MRIGLIGVGPWGSLLGRKAMQAGATIVAHSRSSSQPHPDFGQLLPIDEIVDSTLVDGLIVASNPEVNIDVTLKAANAGLPVIASKPLRVEQDIQLKAPLFVDFVRLWSHSYRTLRKAIEPEQIDLVQIFFSGPGPVRSFSGIEDYGSHALAFVHDLLPGPLEVTWSVITTADAGKENCGFSGLVNGKRIAVITGNASEVHQRYLLVRLKDGTKLEYEEGKPTTCFRINGQVAFSEDNQDPVSTMIESFMWHSRAGQIDTAQFKLAKEVQTSLRKIRSASWKRL
jgi:predicted dehydrogenase